MERRIEESKNRPMTDDTDRTEQTDVAEGADRIDAVVEELTKAWAAFLRQVPALDDAQAA